ncbi:MAG: hypothetical protein N2517_05770, partial [Ignavibacteria bacterium]|nr:hypothetical protein [Ignavibacteria bacterium]
MLAQIVTQASCLCVYNFIQHPYAPLREGKKNENSPLKEGIKGCSKKHHTDSKDAFDNYEVAKTSCLCIYNFIQHPYAPLRE